jgi:HlyD family secretion protein
MTMVAARAAFVLTALVALAHTMTARAPALAQPSVSVPHGMAVSVVRAARRCFVDQLRFSGTLVAREEVLVRPGSEGLLISQIVVEDGERVASGQALAQLAQPGAEGSLTTMATLRAPVAGLVNYRVIRIGMRASTRAEPLFRIIVNGEIELQGELAATRIEKLAVGQSAQVTIAGLGERIGRVRVVSPEIDLKTQLGKARVSLETDDQFKVGAYARAIVTVGRSCGLSVPLSAVFYGREGTVVQVVTDSRVEMHRVRVGLLANGDAEIREGLNENDLVVARAGAFLREGDEVRAILGVTNGRETR